MAALLPCIAPRASWCATALPSSCNATTVLLVSCCTTALPSLCNATTVLLVSCCTTALPSLCNVAQPASHRFRAPRVRVCTRLPRPGVHTTVTFARARTHKRSQIASGGATRRQRTTILAGGGKPRGRQWGWERGASCEIRSIWSSRLVLNIRGIFSFQSQTTPLDSVCSATKLGKRRTERLRSLPLANQTHP
jgi:hypothetical protein